MTRTKTSAYWEATQALFTYLFVCLFDFICFRMRALFLLLVDHVSKLNSGNTLLCCFGLVLISPKGIFAKDKCKGKPQICF